MRLKSLVLGISVMISGPMLHAACGGGSCGGGAARRTPIGRGSSRSGGCSGGRTGSRVPLGGRSGYGSSRGGKSGCGSSKSGGRSYDKTKKAETKNITLLEIVDYKGRVKYEYAENPKEAKEIEADAMDDYKRALARWEKRKAGYVERYEGRRYDRTKPVAPTIKTLGQKLVSKSAAQKLKDKAETATWGVFSLRRGDEIEYEVEDIRSAAYLEAKLMADHAKSYNAWVRSKAETTSAPADPVINEVKGGLTRREAKKLAKELAKEQAEATL